MKVLVVEDDQFLLNAYKVKLPKEGFETECATDGNKAIKALKNSIPDLILLDLVMPKKDGFAVLKDLKDNDKWKDIPVIVASNLGQQEDIDRAIKLGANAFIIKSDLSMKSLVGKMNDLVSKKK